MKLLFLLVFFTCKIFGQASFFSGFDYEFSDEFMYSLAVNKDLTDDFFQNDRKTLKIKTIVHIIKLSNNPDSIKFAKGTAFANTKKTIRTLHFSTKNIITYDTNGIMISNEIYPILNNNEIDTSLIKYLRTKTIIKIIDYDDYKYVLTFKNKTVVEKNTYFKGLRTVDSTSEGVFKYEYDQNNQLIKVLKNKLLLLEYIYSPSKITIKKFQRYIGKNQDTLQVFYNFNEISNKSKVIKSTFINNYPDDLKTEITFNFDKKGEVISSKKKLSYDKKTELISKYKNIYKNNKLLQVLYRPELTKKSVFIYSFNNSGFIEKIETDFSSETFEFEYF
jgi:hypothetical protein